MSDITCEDFFTPYKINGLVDYMGYSRTPQSLFSTYYMHAESDFSNLDGAYIIPTLSHQIWLTNPNNPKEIRDNDLANLEHKIQLLNKNNNASWEHYLWTNCRSCIPTSTKRLESLNVTVNDIANFNGQLKTVGTINSLVQNKLIGLAADILRYEIVSKFGGFYSDLNYEIIKSPENLMKSLNFFADNIYYYVENYMFGASANHTIVNSALNETLYLLENQSIMGLNISDISNDDLTNIAYYFAFVGSFNRLANINTKDLAIPHLNDIQVEFYNEVCSLDYPSILEEIQNYFTSNKKCYDLSFGDDGMNGQTWSDSLTWCDDPNCSDESIPSYQTLDKIKRHSAHAITEYDEFNMLEVLDKAQFNFSLIGDVENRYKHLEAPATDSFRIPAKSHFIWLSKYSPSKEVSDQDLKAMISTLKILDSDKNYWQHNLWTNCISCISETIEKLSEYHVVPRHFSEIYALSKSYHIIYDLIEFGKFGIASDFLRLNILNEFGGIYFDLNYMLQQSPVPYMKTFDFLAHSDRGGAFVDVFMIAAKPHHPILEEATTKILHNFQNPPSYVQEALNLKLHIQDLTGVITYIPFNMAVYNHLNEKTIDFIFPLEVRDGYPENAKKPEISIDLIEQELEGGSCANLTDALPMQIKGCAMANAILNDICVDTILGFDSIFGNTWFSEPALYS